MIEIFILSLIQGLTEFIPISSSSHLILISDYGHGLISSKIAKILLSQKKMVCLNAQVNASNTGYHSLRKYKKMNTLIINETELRHENIRLETEISQMIKE